ncbi:MAG: signal recognition particle-docking protein FtsY [Anaerolineales bacterium]|nr:signal recognition particle-docking protein FtsY [Anaerolineales bacterium]MCB9143140.1 signal recognition particle-docking protein FtsY [Anaerolineales bacterium]MCO5245866.1 signal recognition particle-docking protein FtsY [Anaerolineae bacterium]HRX03161.1 signal recognition particle-docking protein FtsY [Anaerolineae bacterium]
MALRLFRRSTEEQQADEQRIHDSLEKTRGGMFGRLGNIFQANEITEQTWDELEETLIMGDVGIETTEVLVARVQQRVSKEGIKRPADAQAVLKQEMLAMLGGSDAMEIDEPRLLTVVLVVGVNGSGKTTSIAKLAKLYKDHGRKVVLAAADTFRAAAVHQLQIWGERVGVDVIAQGQGADPGAVVFDAIRACQETRKADLLIIDTAGRLHTKFNLMKELEKVRNVASRQVHKAPHETFLILDASTGQNALSQARHFKEAVKVTGVILTKLDGTAKGGIVFAIAQELGVPVRFVGTGERMTDIAPFDPKIFVDSLFA